MIEDPELLGLLGELSEGDGDDTVGDISRALDKMSALSDPLLASLLCSKEGVAKMKDRIVVEDPELRCILIRRLGKNIVRTWITVCSDSFDLEGYIRVENRSEARRAVEDFIDAATDIMKNFAQGALGRAPAAVASQLLPDNVHCVNAYCEVLTYLCDRYCAAFEPLDGWTDASMGVSGSGSRAVHTSAHVALRSSGLSLLPLVKAACTVAFKDRYQLINRCREYPSYAHTPLRFVSSFMRALLLDVSPTASLLTVLDSSEMESGAGQNLFGGGSTEMSLSGHLPLPVVEYVTTWVNTFLVNILTSHVTSGANGCVLEEFGALLKDVICLTQHTVLSSLRHQVCDVVLQKLFYLIENHSALQTASSASTPSTVTVVSVNELTAWTLLMLRYITPSPTTTTTSTTTATDSVSYPYYTRLFKILCYISDPITQTRFFAEYATLLVHHAMHSDCCVLPLTEEFEKHSVGRGGYKFTAMLPSALLRSAIVRTLIETSTKIVHAAILVRFVNALCTAYATVLQYTLTPVLALAPVVLEAEAKLGQMPVKAMELDLFNFSPTTDTSATASGGVKSVSTQYASLLGAYLQGSAEVKHPWDLLQHTLCTTSIHSVCCTIHTLLHPVHDSVASVYTVPTEASVLDSVKKEYTKLVAILVRLVEGAVFAVKTFEGCLKWPMGEAPSTVHTIYKGDAAPGAITSLLTLLAKVLHTSSDYGVFSSAGSRIRRKSSVADDSFVATGASASVNSALAANRTSAACLLSSLVTYMTPHYQTIQGLRTEIVYILHLTLEWMLVDYSKVPQAAYVYQLLHTMVAHRMLLPTTSSTTSTGKQYVTASGTQDILGSGELLLKQIRAMLYHNNKRDEYLLTLQAKSMQGLLGGAQVERYDGSLDGIAVQLQALELLMLLVKQLCASGNVTGGAAGIGHNDDSLLQQAVTLLRTVERDFVWSEAFELKNALLNSPTDLVYKSTFTTTAGVIITKLPVSPVLRDKIDIALQEVIRLVYSVSPTAALPTYAVKLYAVSEVQAYLKHNQNGFDLFAYSDVGAFTEYTPAHASSKNTIHSNLLDVHSAPVTICSALSTSDKDGNNGDSNSVCDSVVALLELYRVNNSALSYDATDNIQAMGLFSSTNAAFPTSPALAPHVYINSADLTGQVQDILTSHLHSVSAEDKLLKANLDVFLPNNAQGNVVNSQEAMMSAELYHQYLSTAMLPPRAPHYTVVSGSADLLTVSAYSTIDLMTSTAYVHVRVYNSSGFKIPTFAIHLVLNSNQLCVNRDTTQSSNHSFNPTTNSIIATTHSDYITNTSASTTTSHTVVFDATSVHTANGVDFFLPDAYVERTFSCKIVHFAPFQAIVRVVYADLVYDEDDIYEIPLDLATTTSNTATATASNRLSRVASVNKLGGHNSKNASKMKKNATAAANASTRGDRYMDEYKTEGHSNKWTAVLDCAPLHVPITSMLGPYGHGTYTAMQYWQQNSVCNVGTRASATELSNAGIIEEIFSSQWRRLGGRYECSVPVDGDLVLSGDGSSMEKGPSYLSAQVNVQLEEAVRRAVTTGGGIGMHLLGLDSKVKFDKQVLDRYKLSTYGYTHNTIAEGCESKNGFAPYAAWALQTPQGAEVSIKLIIDTDMDTTNHSNTAVSNTLASGISSININTMSVNSDTIPCSSDIGTTYTTESSVFVWTGRLVVRCSDNATLQAVLVDMEYLIYALSGGYMGMANQELM